MTQQKIKTYKNKKNLKASNQDVEYTDEQKIEIFKCMTDINYFCENYVKIVHVDHGLINFKPYPYQKQMFKNIKENRYTIFKLPRQSGKTTGLAGFMLHEIIFQKNYNIYILANKEKTAKKILAQIKKAYENLPLWLQQGVLEWNQLSIELENDSKISVSGTSADAARGESINLLYLDEFAFVSTTMADEFMASVYPVISSGTTTKIAVTSTPNGMNHFYKMWNDAAEGLSNFIPLEVQWNDVGGRDEQWKEEQIKNIGEERWLQEFEAEFIGSSNTLINPKILKNLAFKRPIETVHDHMDIYEYAKEDHTYVIVVDTARGKALDYSAFTVIDISEFPYRLVAKYRDNEISAMVYPEIVFQAGMHYNTAWVLIEVNDLGQQVADILHYDLEYEAILTASQKGRNAQSLGEGTPNNIGFGVVTSKAVKSIGCGNIRDLIENHKLIIEDVDVITELSTFIATKTSYAAEEGCNDDLVMTLVLFGWLVKQDYFKELADIDIRGKIFQKKLEMLEEEALPFFFKDDGIENWDDDLIL